ncbi:helix-turn-helix transcriptional regulator [Clostridium sp. 'White wine YQ']|uniref:helix-turn-helix transcriptional regulator n=1 Tax=Clostridium sp. 'White wine YQ' TaxID=3027474 RepID=UPI0023661642|nr:helix-turn-helix transcriptional regulator [Clostridium sp. 'White wine YQ']MDD7795535.1 helix-turn-helix transcriptional regulator [Clostridium sp. 'White wine YQ']
MNEITLQQSLGEFLRANRERLTPEQVGLPSNGRRRTPGLRREEVAQLANVGVSWYTSIEQGKDVHPSHQVLESLAAALRLSDDERRYLFLLAKSDEMGQSEIYKDISIGLERAVFALEPHPAYIIDKYWDILLWNRAAEYIFQFPPYSENMNTKPNLLHSSLIDPLIKENISDWEERAKIVIARFRADCARSPKDARLNEMIEKYKQESEFFRLWWPRYEVKTVTDCHKLLNDPQIGELEFDHVNLQLSDYPDLKLMIYTASPSTVDKLKEKIYSTK